MKNKQFLMEELLPIAISKFRQISGSSAAILQNAQNQIRKQQAPIPKKRNVYQTDVF